MLLEPIFEQDFRGSSYGFRPGRSAHQALEEMRTRLMEMRGGWVLEADIRKYFDSLSQTKLREIFRQRVCDGVVTRLLGKWLKAGVMEKDTIHYPKTGTPQGGVISPLLSNIYLHEVLDEWFEKEVRPRMQGESHLIRYADDFVILFKQEADAKRVMEVLHKRFEKYGLELHPEKTRIIPFQRPKFEEDSKTAQERGSTSNFQLLGFNHYWGHSSKGYWVIKQETASDRLSRSLKAIHAWCKRWRHLPVEEQSKTLRQKMQGHYAYYGITGNNRALNGFYYHVVRTWKKWLCRRSQKARKNWENFKSEVLNVHPLPYPKIVHSIYGA